MSILIKGMEMPECCVECEWHEYYGGDYDLVHACRRTGTMPIENAETERANDCPLVEIQVQHGRLIDADKLLRDAPRYVGCPPRYEPRFLARLDVENAPSVIEAEGNDE